MLSLLEIPLIWLFVIESLLLLFLVATERNTMATVSLFLFGLAARYLSGVDVITFLKTNAPTIGKLLVVYLVTGIAWGIAKWFFFVRDKKEKYLELLKEKQDVSIRFSLGCSIPPQAGEHKAQITGWIGYWPLSLIWTLLDDFLTKFFQQVYATLAGVFQKISDNQFKGINIPKK